MDGCFAQYVLMNAEFAVKLPSGMDPYASAPIYCAGVTMYKALKTANVRPGEWVSIVGIGGLGKKLFAREEKVQFVSVVEDPLEFSMR